MRIVDTVIDRRPHRFEGDVLRHPGAGDPSRFLIDGNLLPSGPDPIVGTNVQLIVARSDQVHVGVPQVVPSSWNGVMCRSSRSAIWRNSSCDQVLIEEPILSFQ
jgi:hypothetical protein